MVITMNYSILDANSVCINTVALSEDSDWQAPDGCTLVPQSLDIGCTYQLNEAGSSWVEVYRPKPSEDELASRVRAERNQLLANSDWTQLQDSPLNADAKLAWQLYRETLRMIPQQESFPWEIQWPPEPTT